MKLRHFAIVFCLISAVTANNVDHTEEMFQNWSACICNLFGLAPPTTSNPQPKGKCQLKISNKCVEYVDVTGEVKLAPCKNEKESQKFFIRDGRIRSEDGRCLGTLNGILKLYDCDRSPAQQFESLSSKQWRQTNTNKCINVKGAIFHPELMMYSCWPCGFFNQAIETTCVDIAVPLDPNGVATQPKVCKMESLKKCIGPIGTIGTEEGGMYQDGAELGLHVCDNQSLWTVSNYAIISTSTPAFCMEAQPDPNDSDDEYPALVLKPCNGLDAQKFVFLLNGQIRNKQFNLCLDIEGGDDSTNARLILFRCKDARYEFIDNQNFGGECIIGTVN